MAKGQQRSNREVRKPKKEKVPVKATSPFGSQVRQADNLNRRTASRSPEALQARFLLSAAL
jgi:hypothetical protein